MNVHLSAHAAQRAAQRNLARDEIDFLLQYGHLVHNTGVLFCQLRGRDIPDDLPANHPYRRLEGSTAVLCRCGAFVVTLYREQKAFRTDRHKPAYNRRSYGPRSCPYCHGLLSAC